MNRKARSRPPGRALVAWFQRTSPVYSLATVLVITTIVFVGCLQFTETGLWRAEPRKHPPGEPPPDRRRRVRLFGRAPRSSEEMAVTSSFVVTESRTSKRLSVPGSPIGATVVRPSPAGGIDLGPTHLACEDVLITPARDASIILAGQTYRGAVRIQRAGAGLVFTNHLDVEAYLRGVLRGELPRSFHPESFKTQAVAARTYVLYQKQKTPADRDWDVNDDESSQMYAGVRAEDPIAVHAVEATSGEVCAWDDGRGPQMFCTYYSSCCGGLSQHVNNVKPNDPPAAPLAGGVVCTDCYLAPSYRWGPVTLTKTEITRRLLARYPAIHRLGTITDLRPKSLTPDGRIIRLEIVGSGGQKETLVGEDFRLCIGGRVLKSTNFKIEPRGDRFAFKDGKGFGHGLGLCQHGMEAKAHRGLDYRQILAAYYPGSTIKKLY